MARIAFIGLGRMGRGMVGRLVAAGHDVVVANRTQSRASALVAGGARSAENPASAVEGVDAVFAMVSDDEASREVWQGTQGVLAGRPARGALAIECSTLSSDRVAELSGATVAAGLRYLDCPVTGLPDMAAAGTLTLLVGGATEDLDAARPLLAPLAERILHFGPVGSGTAYKLIVNLIGAVQIAGVAEGLVIAERAGLDLGQVMDALAGGQAASPQVVRNGLRMVAADHDREVSFPGRLRHKDTAYALQLAQLLDVGAPLGHVALEGLEALLASGLGEQNESAVIEIARQRVPRARPEVPPQGIQR